MPPSPFIVRPMTAADAPAVSRLSAQLSELIPAAAIIERLTGFHLSNDHGCYVAEHDGIALGWVDVFRIQMLISPHFFAEIGGLVVDTEARRKGVGRALIAQAEAWATEYGYAEVRLRSGLHRTDAHEFYQSIGYTLAKTSHMFRKTLSSPKEAGNENLHGSP